MSAATWLARKKHLPRRAYRLATARWRALPGFLVIGVMKGGTTSFFEYLRQHPKVSASTKEVQFFGHHWERGPTWYRSHFPLAWTLAQGGWTGEATPYYFSYPKAAERARRIIPDARLFLVLRDPVDRAWSHYRYWVQKGYERREFSDVIRLEIDALARGETERSRVESGLRRRHDADHAAGLPVSWPYVERGHYAEHLRLWQRWFDPARIWIADSSELFADPATVMADAFSHLGLPPAPMEYPVFNQTKAGTRTVPDADRVLLREHYRPHDQALAQLVGRRFSWMDESAGR